MGDERQRMGAPFGDGEAILVTGSVSMRVLL
jgi:hypothetical protein